MYLKLKYIISNIKIQIKLFREKFLYFVLSLLVPLRVVFGYDFDIRKN